MRKPGLTCISLVFFLVTGFLNPLFSVKPQRSVSDQDDYLILNGKLWRNLYLGIKGTPYFLSGEYLTGDITFNGKVFRDKYIRYDLFNDEVVLWVNSSTTLILNKEMVDEFTINYMDNKYHVINMGEDSAGLMNGFVVEYYEGPTALYVKYRKEIEILGVDNRYDLFIQMHKIYIRKDGELIQISGSGQLMRLLADRKTELKKYIRQNKLTIMKSEPQTFILLLKYYDSLRHRD